MCGIKINENYQKRKSMIIFYGFDIRFQVLSYSKTRFIYSYITTSGGSVMGYDMISKIYEFSITTTTIPYCYR